MNWKMNTYMSLFVSVAAQCCVCYFSWFKIDLFHFICNWNSTVKDLIAKEISDGIPAENIVIGGFSQGGAVALYTAFATDVKIGGVLALSTWLPLNKHFTDESVRLSFKIIS